MEYEVTSVEKPYGVMGHDSITAIGNHKDGWSISALSAMRRIALKRDIFYVFDPISEQRVYLTTMRDKFGKITLRTVVEGRPTNHLMALRPLRDCVLLD